MKQRDMTVNRFRVEYGDGAPEWTYVRYDGPRGPMEITGIHPDELPDLLYALQRTIDAILSKRTDRR